MPAAIPIISGAVGIAGLLQSKSASDQAASDRQKALQAQQQESQWKTAAEKQAYDIANNYNPEQEAQAGINQAEQQATYSLNKGLQENTAQTIAGGGNPSSTAFINSQTGATRNVMDPLRTFLAEIQSNTSPRRQALFNAVGGQGSLSDAFFKASQLTPQYDPTKSANMLTDALGKIKWGSQTSDPNGDQNAAGQNAAWWDENMSVPAGNVLVGHNRDGSPVFLSTDTNTTWSPTGTPDNNTYDYGSNDDEQDYSGNDTYDDGSSDDSGD